MRSEIRTGFYYQAPRMGVLESSDVVLLMLHRKWKKEWILKQNMIEET